jgi:hypothetical protein
MKRQSSAFKEYLFNRCSNISAEGLTIAEGKVTLPKEAEMFLLSSECIRSPNMLLTSKPLVLGANDELPSLDPVKVDKEVELPPATCTFFVIK